jgi:DNA-binding HxlR family transcriptional regulator
MSVSHHNVRASSVTRALELVGERWSLLVLRDSFLGVRRFEDWQKGLGVARSVLTNRLTKLVRAGIFEKHLYQSNPQRYDYRLTQKGLELYPIALMIVRWERQWTMGSRQKRLHLINRETGETVSPVLIDAKTGKPITVRGTLIKEGPGAGFDRRPVGRIGRRSTVSVRSSIPGTPMNERSLEIMGDRWSWQVLNAAFANVRRFDVMQEELKIASNILSDRLKRLVHEGVFDRHAYQQRPARYEYRLTTKGADLFPIFVMLMQWGDAWMAGGDGPPAILIDKESGLPLEPVVVDEATRHPLDPRQVGFNWHGRGGAARASKRAAASEH